MWTTIWFADFNDAFSHLGLLSKPQAYSAQVIVNDKAATLQYCNQWIIR